MSQLKERRDGLGYDTRSGWHVRQNEKSNSRLDGSRWCGIVLRPCRATSLIVHIFLPWILLIRGIIIMPSAATWQERRIIVARSSFAAISLAELIERSKRTRISELAATVSLSSRVETNIGSFLSDLRANGSLCVAKVKNMAGKQQELFTARWHTNSENGFYPRRNARGFVSFTHDRGDSWSNRNSRCRELCFKRVSARGRSLCVPHSLSNELLQLWKPVPLAVFPFSGVLNPWDTRFSA